MKVDKAKKTKNNDKPAMKTNGNESDEIMR